MWVARGVKGYISHRQFKIYAGKRSTIDEPSGAVSAWGPPPGCPVLALRALCVASGAAATLLLGGGVAISLDHEADGVLTYLLLYGGGGSLAILTLILWILIHRRDRESAPARITKSHITHVSIGPLVVRRASNTTIEPTAEGGADG
jgi:hypothetical protein